MSLVPLENAATDISDVFSRSVATLGKSMSDVAEMWPDQGMESTDELLIAALAGIAAAIAVSVVLALYFRTYRSSSEMVRHGLAAAIAVSLLAVVAYDKRRSAATYLGMASAQPAAEFELRWPPTSAQAGTPAGNRTAWAVMKIPLR